MDKLIIKTSIYRHTCGLLGALLLIAVGCVADLNDRPSVEAGSDGFGGSGGFGSGGAGTNAVGGSGGAVTPSGGGTGASGPNSGAGGVPGGSVGLPSLGTLVVLGDSIGDGGGQGPYYYELLRDQLESTYGSISYQRKAESGSKTAALMSQIGALPAALPGPVAVTITSGGNDMKDQILPIVAGVDGPARDAMSANIDTALSALLEPDRFGPGVDVFVYYGTIYDASDGAGDYGSQGCNFGQGFPTIAGVDTYFDNWNGAIQLAVDGHGQTTADVHGFFYGHGYHTTPTWYASDCTHPNSLGHQQLADYFEDLITGG